MTTVLQSSIAELLHAYRSGLTSPGEVCHDLLKRIEDHDVKVGAFLRVDRDDVLRQAEVSNQNLHLPLAGVPLAIKDNISTQGIETTCSSKILAGYLPPYDATVIERLKEAGAIILGKTNCDEFAMGSSTENSAFQLTHNPWDLENAPGGSSGGSAAAVAACFAYGALGSDTGGSVRQPSALCGVVGLKPTYGRVSRYGLVAFGSSLDCIGPIARSVEDAALLLQVIAGQDSRDGTSAQEPVPEYAALLAEQNGSTPLRIGIPREYFGSGLDPEIAAIIEGVLRKLEQSGKIQLVSVSLPHSGYAIAAYYVIATAEASSNLSRFDGVRYGYRSSSAEREAAGARLQRMYATTRDEGFGQEVKRRIMLGTFALSAGYYDAYYLRASKVRSLIAKDFQNAFSQVDLICTPTTPTVAFPLGERTRDPLAMYLSDVYTVTMSLAGIPAISVPCGMHSAGLPVGLQIAGNYLEEPQIFSLASFVMKEVPPALPAL